MFADHGFHGTTTRELANEAGISEALFGTLLAPVLRVGALPAPLPYAAPLERLALPGPERLLEALEWVLAYGA